MKGEKGRAARGRESTANPTPTAHSAQRHNTTNNTTPTTPPTTPPTTTPPATPAVAPTEPGLYLLDLPGRDQYDENNGYCGGWLGGWLGGWARRAGRR